MKSTDNSTLPLQATPALWKRPAWSLAGRAEDGQKGLKTVSDKQITMEDVYRDLDRLTETALKIKAERDALLAAACGIKELLDSGQLVRDTSHDHESGWAIKQIPFVQKLKALVDAIALVEGQ